MNNSKAVIVQMDKLNEEDKINNRIIFSFNNLDFNLLESDKKIYAFKFYIDNPEDGDKDEFILYPFKIDYEEQKIEFIYTWLFDIDLYLDRIEKDVELEYDIIEILDLDSLDEKLNIVVDQNGLPNIRQLLDKLDKDQYDLYYYGKDNNLLFNQFIDFEIKIKNIKINNELLKYHNLKKNRILTSGSKYFIYLIKKIENRGNFFTNLLKKKKRDEIININLDKDSNKLNKNYKIFEDDNLKVEGTFKDCVLIEGKIYYKNGNLVVEGTFKDDNSGEGKLYYDNGKKMAEGTFKDGKLIEGKTYNEDGKIWGEGTFKDGYLNGEGKLYYDNGKLSGEGTFKDGLLNGEGKYYYKNGKLEGEGTFKDGYLIVGKYYYENGNLIEEIRID